MSHPIPYDLAFTLHAHSSDVRNLCVPSPGVPLLLSGSRDGSACVWGPPSNGGREWDVKLRVEGPEKRFISCTGMVRSDGEGERDGITASSPTSVAGRRRTLSPCTPCDRCRYHQVVNADAMITSLPPRRIIQWRPLHLRPALRYISPTSFRRTAAGTPPHAH
jgi:hypothetical protein